MSVPYPEWITFPPREGGPSRTYPARITPTRLKVQIGESVRDGRRARDVVYRLAGHSWWDWRVSRVGPPTHGRRGFPVAISVEPRSAADGLGHGLQVPESVVVVTGSPAIIEAVATAWVTLDARIDDARARYISGEILTVHRAEAARHRATGIRAAAWHEARDALVAAALAEDPEDLAEALAQLRRVNATTVEEWIDPVP